LAKLVGSDQGHISRIENGDVTPSTDLLTRIAHTLDMSLPQLIGEDTREAQKAYSAKHPAYKILKDAGALEGLKALANDRESGCAQDHRG
jgi:transcriptional regulator with XRE-family HTH domain